MSIKTIEELEKDFTSPESQEFMMSVSYSASVHSIINYRGYLKKTGITQPLNDARIGYGAYVYYRRNNLLSQKQALLLT